MKASTVKGNQDNFKDNLKSYRERTIQPALDALGRLLSLAKQLDKREAAIMFQDMILKLEEETFKLAIVGRFKNGKSTFANALLGFPSNGRIMNGSEGPMPTAEMSCTAVLTYVHYDDQPSVQALLEDSGTLEEWSFERYLEKGRVQINDKNNQAFNNIKSFLVGYPSPLLAEGLILIDTPGTDDAPERTRNAREAISKADAAIVLYCSRPFAGESEMAFIDQFLYGTVSKIYTVVNMFPNPNAKPGEFKQYAWNRLLGEKTDRPYDPEGFADYGIYFIDAWNAFEGRRDGNQNQLEQSGLPLFERAVSDFLTRERSKTHLLSSVLPAANAAKELANDITRQQTTLTADAAQFRQVLEKLRPRLQELKRRPEEIRRVFSHYENRIVAKVTTDFEAFLLKLIDEIPEYMEKVKLDSLEGYMDVLFKQKECAEEARTVGEAYIKKRTTEWAQTEATPKVSQEMTQLSDELELIIGKIKSDSRYIELQLNSAVSIDNSVSMVNKWDKLLWVALGIVTRDPTIALTGGTFGWRGAATSFLTQFAVTLTGLALGLSFGAAAIIAIVGGALASFFIGRGSAGQNLRKNVGNKLIEAIQKTMRQRIAEVQEDVRRTFAETRDPFLNLIQNQINQDLESIEQMERDNEQGQTEKLAKIKQLDRIREEVIRQEKILSDIHLNA